jgi:hypothetical protein
MPTTVQGEIRDAFAREWLTCTLLTYPDHARRVLREQRDPFRNPVGHALRAALRALAEELLGEFDRLRVDAALDPIVRIRAVQDFADDQAIGFVRLARQAARTVAAARMGSDGPAIVDLIDRRIDELEASAAEQLRQCRAQIRDIAAHAARRRTFVLDRLQARRGACGMNRGGSSPLPARGRSV